ncbi:MBL fold metallo-hydrolase [Mycobacterium sp. OAE908]|uniref:MBL fold metallo-hydrolase n=1 Tax=Mycobacterium sp. OAE908 TaxID=2817899 RepID=UPI001AE5C0EA
MNSSLDRIDEPYVHEFLRANIWHLRGKQRDLVVDTGLGVASLRAQLPQLFERDPVVVLTHAHLDHMGGAHEFDSCCAYPGEPFEDPPPGSLYPQPLVDELGLAACEFAQGLPILISAVPHRDYALADYRLRPAPGISWLQEGDRIDLGDRQFTVLHLPGHTPGGVALFDESDGTLFSGDVVYDDLLIDTCIGADISDYIATMKRLIELDVTVVHPGHGHSFDRSRLREIATTYRRTTDQATTQRNHRCGQ